MFNDTYYKLVSIFSFNIFLKKKNRAVINNIILMISDKLETIIFLPFFLMDNQCLNYNAFIPELFNSFKMQSCMLHNFSLHS